MKDEELRRLLSDAVSDIEPRESLGSIHARTKVSPMQRKRPWLLGAAAAVVATAATVTAVTMMSNDGTTGSRPPSFAGPSATAGKTQAQEPSAVSKPSPSTGEPSQSAAPATVMETVPVYYVGETSHGVRLYREFHRVDTGGDPVAAAVNQAVATSPTDRDYRTDWPEGTTAAHVDAAPSDVVTVDVRGDASLHDRPADLSKEQADMAVEQLIYTAQAAQQSREAVQLLLNGHRTDTILGVPTSEPLAQADAGDVLAQVWIIEPGEGAKTAAPFKVSGLAAAFEANVQWELKEGNRVVKRGFTTAEECCRMAPYSFTVNAPPGSYTLVVHDSDPSGGEGFAPWQDTKQITVVP
ncbi:MAG TPA: Gmad2 immunoglobulin-like domain-containing protein [Nocardioidaceae bacterium]|nr:Gmad2 immunoglobulin-like domain-containing protein [Nocardioidaceae bacterium]